MIFDVEGFVYRHFSDITETTNSSGDREMRVDCPSGCRDKKFYINLNTGRAQCFKCGLSFKSLFNLIQGITGASKQEVTKIIREGSMEGPSYSFERFEDKVVAGLFKMPKTPPEPARMPKEAKPVMGSTNLIGKSAYKWLKSRGLSDDEIKNNNIHYCATGQYKKRVILPVYRYGQLLYFNARWIGKPRHDSLKVLNPEKGDAFVGKSELVFNLDKAMEYKMGVLVEGFFDAIITGENAMALMGKFLSDSQLYLILNAGFEEIVVMMDADAHEYTIQIAEKLSQYIPTKIALLDEGDPADLGRDRVWDHILSAQPYDWEYSVRSKVV